jgi:chemotaxis receptor (MCP) glutamine deamidase CheD
MSVSKIDIPTVFSTAAAAPNLGQASLKELSLLQPGGIPTSGLRQITAAPKLLVPRESAALEEQASPDKTTTGTGRYSYHRLTPRSVEVGTGAREFKPANPWQPPVLTISGAGGTSIGVTERKIPLGRQSTPPAELASNIPPATSVTLARVKEFAADASKFEAFLADIPAAKKELEIRRLLQAAAQDLPVGDLTATSLISHLKGMGFETAGFEASLLDFQRARTQRDSLGTSLPPEDQRGAKRTVKPETKQIQAADVAVTEVVPQNTLAMVKPGDSSVRQLVTTGVFDCVVVTYWDPVTKTGGLAHIPVDSNADLSALHQELKRQGLSPEGLKFTILGGVDYSSVFDQEKEQFFPSAVRSIYSIERQLSDMGVPKTAIGLHTIHNKEEVIAGSKSNIGINLDTGATFFFSDPNRLLPSAPNRGYGELRDPTTDLYVVDRSS